MDGQDAFQAHDLGVPLVMIVANDRNHEASALVEILKDEDIEATIAVWRGAALTTIATRCPDVIVVDENTAPIAELAVLLSQLRGRFSDALTVLMTSWCPRESALWSALDSVEGRCLEKPIAVRELVELARAMSRARRA